MNIRHTLIGAMALGVCATAATASAATAEASEWAHKDLEGGQLIYAQTQGTAGLGFMCTDGGQLAAVVNIDGADLAEKFEGKLGTKIGKKGTLDIEGRETTRDKWIYYPGTSLAEPRDPSVGRKLYNAAVTGKGVTLKLSYVDQISISAPELNEAFQTFATSCSATNGS